MITLDEQRLTSLKRVKHFADRVIVMCKGEVVEEGETQTLFEDPKHEYTRMLIN